MLSATTLVMIMTMPGLALYYGGFSNINSHLNTMSMVYISYSLTIVIWVTYGYTLTFSGDTSGIIGNFNKTLLHGLSPLSINPDFETIPEFLFVAYEYTFVSITVALVSGGLIERVKFWAWVLFVILWTTFVYLPVAHWVWHPEGFLRHWGVLDFAGGTVVHVNSGIATLIGTLVVGRRITRHENPRNMGFVLIGTCLLWFGFMGFNAGSAFQSNERAAVALINTNVSAAVASVTWMMVQTTHTGKPTLAGLCDGAIAGLVGITPAGGYVNLIGAIVIGILEGILPYWAIILKTNYNLYDDTFNTFALHCVAGTIGAIAVGIYADKKVCTIESDKINRTCSDGFISGNYSLLGKQVVGVLVCIAYSGLITLIIMLVIKKTIGVRVNELEEREGLDKGQHGGEIAYREFDENEMFVFEEVEHLPQSNYRLNNTSN